MEVGVRPSQTNLQSQGLHVANRPTYSNRETGAPGATPHETHTVTPQKTLEGARISRKGDPRSKVSYPSPAVVDKGGQCPSGPTSAPPASCNSNLYRCLKRRLGCSLMRLHYKQCLVSARKSPAHKLPGTKGSLAGLKKIPASCAGKSCSSGHRQHHSCGLHKQGGRYEVRLTLCPSLATPLLVQSKTGGTKGQAHSGSSECHCRQIVSPSIGHSDRVIPSSGGVQPSGSDLAQARNRHVCNKIQLQTTPLCVASTRSQCVGSGRPDSVLG